MADFFELAALPFSFPWPSWFLGAFAFAMFLKLLLWVLFNRHFVRSK